MRDRVLVDLLRLRELVAVLLLQVGDGLFVLGAQTRQLVLMRALESCLFLLRLGLESGLLVGQRLRLGLCSLRRRRLGGDPRLFEGGSLGSGGLLQRPDRTMPGQVVGEPQGSSGRDRPIIGHRDLLPAAGRSRRCRRARGGG